MPGPSGVCKQVMRPGDGRKLLSGLRRRRGARWHEVSIGCANEAAHRRCNRNLLADKVDPPLRDGIADLPKRVFISRSRSRALNLEPSSIVPADVPAGRAILIFSLIRSR